MSARSIGWSLMLISIGLCGSCHSKKIAQATKIFSPPPTIVPIESPAIQKIIANAIEQTKTKLSNI